MEERVFKGPIDNQLRDALAYIRNIIIVEKVYKVKGQAEAIRVSNYSYDAIEEFISNAIYHKSYPIHESITIRIEQEQIEITSIPGPDRSITIDDIKNYVMRTRRYRNRRIGDFLKELHLIEGRNTGIPTALKATKDNGSPLPKLLTDEKRSYFSVIVPIHEAFKVSTKIESKKHKRRSKNEIKELIVKLLEKESASASDLYKQMRYSGNVSKTVRTCILELIEEGKIYYSEESINSPNTLLIIK